MNRGLSVRDIIFIGLLSAMCVLATTIKVPFGTGAMVHLGTAMLYTIGIVFGGVYAGFAGAIGSAFFDLLMGFSPYTIWSFFIKGIAGLIVGYLAKGRWPESGGRTGWLRMLLACLAAALWTLAGYFAAWWSVTGSQAVAIANIPSSLLTSGAGIIIALLLAPRIRGYVERR